MSNRADVLPVARFSPAPGILLDRTGRSVAIGGTMELWGPEANVARAASVQLAINGTWNRTFTDGYSITCNVVVRYRGPESHASYAVQIEALKMAGPSNVKMSDPKRPMQLNANEPDTFTWTPAHEFGHVIGLDDRYVESIMSKIRGSWGGTRVTSAKPGYAKNLMAVADGDLERQNVEDVAAENEPSALWTNDDDEVRAWVSAHSLAEIGRISTADKLRAIWVLQRGWISDDDMSAMARICSSVTTSNEAQAVRAGVNLLIFGDLGQRTKMRVFLSKMP
jgi:hypothetical protein